MYYERFNHPIPLVQRRVERSLAQQPVAGWTQMGFGRHPFRLYCHTLRKARITGEGDFRPTETFADPLAKEVNP